MHSAAAPRHPCCQSTNRAAANFLAILRRSEEPRNAFQPSHTSRPCFAIGVLIGKALRPQMAFAIGVLIVKSAAAMASPASSYKRADRRGDTKKLDPRVYAFYYAWYQNPATDGLWAHWNHKHLTTGIAAVLAKYPPFVHDPEKRDVGASFFPALGATRLPTMPTTPLRRRGGRISMQLEQTNGDSIASIGVAVVSWYPPGKRDANGDSRGRRFGEGLPGRGGALRPGALPPPGALGGAHGRGAVEGRGLRRPDVRRPRGLPQDRRQVRVLRLRLVPARRARLARGADRGARRRVPHRAGAGRASTSTTTSAARAASTGPTATFGATGFTQASTPSSWKGLVVRASAKGGLFVPCVAPGYDDLRVRPWNGANSRGREAGAYYDRSWTAALASGAARVAVWLSPVARGHADRTRGGGVHAEP